MSTSNTVGNYPLHDSASHINNLPFYQYSQDQQQHFRAQQDDLEERGNDAEVLDPDNAQQDARDESTLRSHLSGMMGGYDGFTPIMQHQQAVDGMHSSSLAHGAVHFAQAEDNHDATIPYSDHAKHVRTKVSRACDECRRKKIRCDAVDETGHAPCTSCARTGARCAFSRQPMKRGPSKGYIKELAERLNTLERQVQPSPSPVPARDDDRGAVGQNPDAQAQAAQMVDPRTGDKRTYAVAEGLHNGSETFNSHTSAEHISSPSQNSAFAQSSSREQRTGMTPFWRHGGNENKQDTTALSHEGDSGTPINICDWDDATLDEYYRIIHQTFPLLPNNKNRLRQRLADCPLSLREGFLAALDCTMRTWPTTNLQPNPNYAQALKKAVEMLAKYPFDNPSTHTNATNLVYLQTLLLMALEADNHGPATIRGQAGPSRAEWLGRAAGVAGQLEINIIRKSNESILGGDKDSEERLARRVWWVLFILDRWHASSTADLLKLPENSVVLLPEDQILLGESTYHLARLSFIIGHLAAILTTTKTPSTDVMAPSNPASSLLGLTLAGEIDRFRESVESVWGSLNLVHLSYHHCHLLIKRLNPATEPYELVGHAVKVATVLNSRSTPLTPLNHHFGALAALTLCELCDISKTRAEALKGLEHLDEALGTGRGLAGKQESEGWDGAVRDLVGRKRERMRLSSSLDTLADAAGRDGKEAEAEERAFDPTMLTRFGYLTALGHGLFKVK